MRAGTQSLLLGRLILPLYTITMACMLFLMLLWTLCSSSSAQHSGEGHLLYAVLIDAGSSGTRIHVYTYTPARDGVSYPDVRLPSQTKQIVPGLSFYAPTGTGAGESLASLIQFAKGLVPESQQPRTPIYLFATAGLRMLPSAQTVAVLKSVREAMAASGFRFMPKWAGVLPGDKEGLYAWVAYNYAAGTLQALAGEASGRAFKGKIFPPPLGQTWGVVELGGASMQITYLPQDPDNVDDMHAKHLNLPGLKDSGTNLYTHSFLGYGADVAFRNASLLQDATKTTPCLPKGYNHSSGVRGSGNFTGCLELLEGWLPDMPCTHSQCSIGGAYLPQLTGVFLATENFFYTAMRLGMKHGINATGVAHSARDMHHHHVASGGHRTKPPASAKTPPSPKATDAGSEDDEADIIVEEDDEGEEEDVTDTVKNKHGRRRLAARSVDTVDDGSRPTRAGKRKQRPGTKGAAGAGRQSPGMSWSLRKAKPKAKHGPRPGTEVVLIAEKEEEEEEAPERRSVSTVTDAEALASGEAAGMHLTGPADLFEAGKRFCNRPWAELQKELIEGKQIPKDYMIKTCFSAAYAYLLLHGSLHFKEDKQLLFSNMVQALPDGTPKEVNWVLGALVAKVIDRRNQAAPYEFAHRGGNESVVWQYRWLIASVIVGSVLVGLAAAVFQMSGNGFNNLINRIRGYDSVDEDQPAPAPQHANGAANGGEASEGAFGADLEAALAGVRKGAPTENGGTKGWLGNLMGAPRNGPTYASVDDTQDTVIEITELPRRG